MRKSVLVILGILFSNFILTPLSSDIRKCSENDIVVSKEADEQNLMKYLKGTWSLSGSWNIVEGQNKIRAVISTKISGTETFTPIMNGHFLEKNLTAKIKYRSKDLNKVVQDKFMAKTLMTFNHNLNKFTYWYFDCSGTFLEAEGTYVQNKKHYRFQSQVMENGEEVDLLYTISIIDRDHYRWEVQRKYRASSSWKVSAKGTSTRQSN